MHISDASCMLHKVEEAKNEREKGQTQQKESKSLSVLQQQQQ